MMRLLVTGASGLLGEKLTSLALKRGFETYGTYNINPIDVSNSVHLNLADRRTVLDVCKKIDPDYIINAAAITDVDLCEREKNLALTINTESAGYLAEASRMIGSHLVQVSTDYIFDGKKGEYSEMDEPNPINNYGYSKLLGEKKVSSIARSWCIARTSVVFGWGREKRPNFATWILNGLKTRKNFSIVTDQYASPTLNTNLAEMLLEIAEKRLQGIYHVAGRDRINRYDMAIKIAETFNLNKSLLSPVESTGISWLAKRPADSSLKVEKSFKELNNKPLHIEEAITQMKRTENQENRGNNFK
ncbi:MAG: dTDP-4-dehydrorhamnose reductase [Thermoproteota archaeon]|nr:dTDP-4-dehydrorhamnose reductase [Thermoproteota archaeon]